MNYGIIFIFFMVFRGFFMRSQVDVLIPPVTFTQVYTPLAVGTFPPAVVPTATIQPTATLGDVSIGGAMIYAGYSYYYPPLGGVNCLEWDDDLDNCVDQTSSGEKWTVWINKGVALHPVHLQACPLLSELVVKSPAEVAGVWKVVDTCPGCWREDAGYLIDFLMDHQVLDWWTPIEAECRRVVP